MSPMLDIQRRHAEVFRIRLGEKGPKGEPRRLTDSIRITSPNLSVVAAFAEVYGGTPQPWNGQHEVYLPTAELPVMILPGESIQQFWELWKSRNEAVCERRCDGYTETLSGKACMCPEDITTRLQTTGACRPMTRLSVVCPDVEVVGAGSLVTHGLIAAETLPQSVMVAQAALSRGLMVPAVLRVVEHTGKKHYIVPQVEIVGVSLTQLTTGEVTMPAVGSGQRQLAAAPAAIESGGSSSTPGGDEGGATVAAVSPSAPASDPPEPRRPSTRPTPPKRSAAPTATADKEVDPDAMTPAQNRMLHALLSGAGHVTDEQRHKVATRVLEREVTTYTTLNKADASKLIDALRVEAAS